MTSSGAVSRKPTMAQIAEAAGTSVPTVSKVLNGGTDVSDATRSRVMEAAHHLGYRRVSKLRAGGETRHAPRIIDVVVGHLDGTWISRVLAGIEETAAASGVDLVLTVARRDSDWISRLLRRPSLGAIVVLVDTTSAQLNLLTTADIPVVVVDPISRPPLDVASIGATNWNGGRMAAEHLLALGHRRFAIVGGTRTHLYSSARIDGFTSALREAGLDVPRDRILHCDWDRRRASAAAATLLAASSRPSAVFACSDIMGLGVYDAAQELGLRIPDDLSVVGFDDVRESAWAAPPMTTVHQPIADMGAAAFRMLLQAHQSAVPLSPSTRATRIELETRLIERASTRRV
ncbi:LacI family DNA-binding transcriptional regulator [Rathayibacter sp. ZW T2_19]|uniref:LacI family DNA-binding transcriptional regulator n=1 Tax=Rathayibacter rubneri TaxID=2950106 RepID=A0A9X2DXR7_9MICO|nr:LacI family DNA-binding transcriptional regulator [Rathayibacter rubneri]MCM6761553.1 LacI family DNA-binding transcriptional regulator [Rathayibacter rubneri]